MTVLRKTNDNRAHTLARLVQNGINMLTVPANGGLNCQSSEEEEAETHQFNNALDNDVEQHVAAASETMAGALRESNSDSEFSPEGRWPVCDNLPARDFFPPRTTASRHVGGWGLG
jgi:hypothetical protein